MEHQGSLAGLNPTPLVTTGETEAKLNTLDSSRKEEENIVTLKIIKKSRLYLLFKFMCENKWKTLVEAFETFGPTYT